MLDKTYAMCKLCTLDPPSTCGLPPYAQAQLFTMWRHCHRRKTIIKKTTEATTNEYRRNVNVCRLRQIGVEKYAFCHDRLHHFNPPVIRKTSIIFPVLPRKLHNKIQIETFFASRGAVYCEGLNAMCTGIQLPIFRGQLAASIFRVQEARRWRPKTHLPYTASYTRTLYSSTKYMRFCHPELQVLW